MYKFCLFTRPESDFLKVNFLVFAYLFTQMASKIKCKSLSNYTKQPTHILAQTLLAHINAFPFISYGKYAEENKLCNLILSK